MKVALAQVDTRIGDFRTNRRVALDAWSEGRARGAELVVLPALVVTGTPPRDLLFDRSFVDGAIESTEILAEATSAGPPLVVGTVARNGRGELVEAAALLSEGRIAALPARRRLRPDGAFHETRWFVPGEPAATVDFGGQRIGICFAPDLVDDAGRLRHDGASLLVVPDASPFTRGAPLPARGFAAPLGLPVVRVNAVGGNDDLLFDGGSFVADSSGRPLARLPRFREAVEVVDLDARPLPEAAVPDETELLSRALVRGIRDFARKNALSRAFLGLSGGVDSALVAALAAEALGPSEVTAIALPSRHTDPRSTGAAAELAASLGIGFEVVEIEPLHAAAEASLPELLGGDRGGRVDENLQPRLRALVLLAFVNRHGGFLLNTSNRTELALGYGTLHGDLAGTLSPIGDLTKLEVHELARWYRRQRGVIPDFILERESTAELRPGQVDPFDYSAVVPVVEAILAGGPLPAGTDPEEARRLRRMIRAAEHKRLHSGIVLRVHDGAFGPGRMVPVTRAGD